MAARATEERQALNNVSRLLRELSAAAPDATITPAARAAAILIKIQSVPAANLPESLRAPWQEMTVVLEAAAESTPEGISADLRRRGEAAAATLNAALAAQGLTDFRF